MPSTNRNRLSLPVRLSSTKIDGCDREPLTEKCGVAGIVLHSPLASDMSGHLMVDILKLLQHRGNQSWGIASSEGNRVAAVTKLGTVTDDNPLHFEDSHPFSGSIHSCHARYATSGEGENLCNAQPMLGSCLLGGKKINFAMSHNGNLTNMDSLAAALRTASFAVGPGESDSKLIVQLMQAVSDKREYKSELDLVSAVVGKLQGSYSLIFHFPDCLIATRDPYGNRPMSIATWSRGAMVASETVAFQALRTIPESHNYVSRELLPGEILSIDRHGMQKAEFDTRRKTPLESAFCGLEIIYFMRPESFFNGITIADWRRKMGAALALEHGACADFIVDIPSGGTYAAKGFSQQSGIPLLPLFLINEEFMANSKGRHRSYIQSCQATREATASGKIMLNENVLSLIAGKTILFVDDSLIRGTSIQAILRKHLHRLPPCNVKLALAFPPVIDRCNWGVSIPEGDKLLYNRYGNPEALAKFLGIKAVHFLSSNNIERVARSQGVGVCLHCTGTKVEMPKPDELINEKFDL